MPRSLCNYLSTKRRNASSSKSARNPVAAVNSGVTRSRSTANCTATSSSVKSKRRISRTSNPRTSFSATTTRKPWTWNSSAAAKAATTRSRSACSRNSTCTRASAWNTETTSSVQISSESCRKSSRSALKTNFLEKSCCHPLKFGMAFLYLVSLHGGCSSIG